MRRFCSSRYFSFAFGKGSGTNPLGLSGTKKLHMENDRDFLFEDYDRPTYERYNGTYAQDVAGFSDQDIDDAFDGEPEAYWNID